MPAANPMDRVPDRPTESSRGVSAELPLSRRLEFLGLDADDAERLRRMTARYQAHADEFLERFYAHLLRFTETAQFLQDEALVENLKRMQSLHVESMLAAGWDDDYAERRRRIGRIHAGRGVEPVLVLGAYSLVLQHFVTFLMPRAGRAGTDVAFAELQSVIKAVFLDLGLTLDAYVDSLLLNLRHALDMYWKANAELRQFAHLTSHDLKTPLATVANLCDEVLDEFGDQIPPAAQALIRTASRVTFRMSSTIDELLSTTIQGEEVRSSQSISSREPILEAAERVQRLLAAKQIELRLPKDYPTVLGNHVPLREVFYNLLSNAAKYIDKRPGRIDVTAAGNGTICTFCVQDNGPGIPSEELLQIFAPFRRLARDHQQGGSGLGLYFTRNLVEQQGGRIWVESDLGEGSRFFVELKSPAAARIG